MQTSPVSSPEKSTSGSAPRSDAAIQRSFSPDLHPSSSMEPKVGRVHGRNGSPDSPPAAKRLAVEAGPGAGTTPWLIGVETPALHLVCADGARRHVQPGKVATPLSPQQQLALQRILSLVPQGARAVRTGTGTLMRFQLRHAGMTVGRVEVFVDEQDKPVCLQAGAKLQGALVRLDVRFGNVREDQEWLEAIRAVATTHQSQHAWAKSFFEALPGQGPTMAELGLADDERPVPRLTTHGLRILLHNILAAGDDRSAAVSRELERHGASPALMPWTEMRILKLALRQLEAGPHGRLRLKADDVRWLPTYFIECLVERVVPIRQNRWGARAAFPIMWRMGGPIGNGKA